MSGLQLAMLVGLTLGLGLTVLLVGVLPRTPALSAAIANLTPDPSAGSPTPEADLTSRVGRWAQSALPGRIRARAPRSDLALLGIDPARHAGEQVLGCLVGLLMPSLLSLAFAAIGLHLPLAIPLAAGLAFGLALFLSADLTVRTRAAEARATVRRALAAYVDLIALERNAAAGTTEAMEAAAAVAPNWVFQRIREALAQARWAGDTPWNGLAELAGHIDVPEMAEVANVMRLAGEESTAVSGTLKARSTALRNAIAEDEHRQANAAGERLVVPLALLAFVYLTLLAAPGVMRVMASL